MDYRGLYEDLLEMIHRAVTISKLGLQTAVNRKAVTDFLIELREFQVDLLLRHYSPTGHINVYY